MEMRQNYYAIQSTLLYNHRSELKCYIKKTNEDFIERKVVPHNFFVNIIKQKKDYEALRK